MRIFDLRSPHLYFRFLKKHSFFSSGIARQCCPYRCKEMKGNFTEILKDNILRYLIPGQATTIFLESRNWKMTPSPRNNPSPPKKNQIAKLVVGLAVVKV